MHPWHGTVANLWGRHKDFTEFNENFEKSYLLNGLSNIVKFFTVWFLKIFCIKWILILFWVQCSVMPKATTTTNLFTTRRSFYPAFSSKFCDFSWNVIANDLIIILLLLTCSHMATITINEYDYFQFLSTLLLCWYKTAIKCIQIVLFYTVKHVG